MAFPYVLHSTVGNSADQRRRAGTGQVSQARAAYGLCRGDRTKWFGHHGTVQRPSVPSTKVPDGAKASRRPCWSLMLPALRRCPALSAQVTGKLVVDAGAPGAAIPDIVWIEQPKGTTTRRKPAHRSLPMEHHFVAEWATSWRSGPRYLIIAF